MSQKTLINGTAYEITQGRTLVNGTGYDIYQGRTLVGGTGYDIFFGRPLHDYAPGESVYTYLNGVLTEFMVVHHGNPDASLYVGCDAGTWLIQKEIAYEMAYSEKNGTSYKDSSIHSFLNSTYIGRFDQAVQSMMIETKIPYAVVPAGEWREDATIYSGINGVSAKAFVPSAWEVGFSNDSKRGTEIPTDGAKLDWFDISSLDGAAEYDTPDATSKRAAKYNGVASDWRTRTPWIEDAGYQSHRLTGVNDEGNAHGGGMITDEGIRPIIILPSKTRTERKTAIIKP